MAEYMFYSIRHNENRDVELKCCIDLDTIDDDEPTVEYLQNDGTWAQNAPNYWKTDGEDLTPLFDQLKEIESVQWGWFTQILADCGDILVENDIWIRDFDDARLYISYDENFGSEIATSYPLGEVVENDYNE